MGRRNVTQARGKDCGRAPALPIWSVMTFPDDPYRPFADIIADHGRAFPERTFVHAIHQDRGMTYGALAQTVNRVADYLTRAGIGRGDRVMVLSGNALEFVAVYFGALRHGATLCTVNVEMNAAHLGEIVGAVAPRLALHQDGLDPSALGLDRLTDAAATDWRALGEWRADGGTGFFADIADCDAAYAAPPLVGRDDPGVIFYTSGTMAKPKGVVYSHGALFYNFDAVADMVGLQAGERVLDFRSLAWISAQQMVLGGPLTRGATGIIADRFSRSRYLGWARDHAADIGACVPAAIAMLLNEPDSLRDADLPRLRFITSSSAPLLVEQWKAFEALYGIPIAQGYGASEAGWITGTHADDRRMGTVGRVLMHQHLRIVDPHGDDVAPGEIGEIEASGGRQQSTGYLQPDGTIERMAPGGVRTGDLGRLDADGYLTVAGRMKELIVKGGVNIAPLEIDGVIAELDGIADVCTVGVPDPIYGEEVVSYVTLRNGSYLTARAILAHCETRLPDFKRPRQVILRDSLPRTVRGKLDRNALASAWRQEETADG